MLYSCEFTWFPGTTREAVAQRVVAQHDAGANNPERIKGGLKPSAEARKRLRG